MNSAAKTLVTKIQHLTAERMACTTEAARKCVQESIDDARRQLDDLRLADIKAAGAVTQS